MAISHLINFPVMVISDPGQSPTQNLKGWYSFVLYEKPEKVFVMKRFQEYKSYHYAIDFYIRGRLESMGKTNSAYRFFQAFKPVVRCGGEILLDDVVLLFNFFSGAYSNGKVDYADLDHESSAGFHLDRQEKLQKTIESTGLPIEPYISIQQTEIFKSLYLHKYFESDGQFKKDVLVQDFLSEIRQGLGRFVFDGQDDLIREEQSLFQFGG